MATSTPVGTTNVLIRESSLQNIANAIREKNGGTDTYKVSEMADAILAIQAEEPTGYTNLADPTSTDWKDGYRLSISSGGTSLLAGHTSTNFIPCKQGDVLRVKGMAITGYASSSTDASNAAKIVMYDASKTKLGGAYGVMTENSNDGYGLRVATDGDISTYTIFFKNNGEQASSASSCAYIRVDGLLLPGYSSTDVVITINEEIKNTSGVVITLENGILTIE